MLTRQQITDILQKEHAYLTVTYGLKRIGLFGSYAKSVSDEQSDIDLVAEFDSPIGWKFMEFTDYLEHLFGIPVDVIAPAGIKRIRNPQIAKEILETVIYTDFDESAGRSS